MIEELFTPYAESLELKKLGFEEECFASISKNDDFPYIPNKGGKFKSSEFYNDFTVACPLYSQAFNFFRKKYNFDKVIGSSYNLGKTYFFRIETPPTNGYEYFQGRFETYEKARLECLRKLIKICQEQ